MRKLVVAVIAGIIAIGIPLPAQASKVAVKSGQNYQYYTLSDPMDGERHVVVWHGQSEDPNVNRMTPQLHFTGETPEMKYIYITLRFSDGYLCSLGAGGTDRLRLRVRSVYETKRPNYRDGEVYSSWWDLGPSGKSLGFFDDILGTESYSQIGTKKRMFREMLARDVFHVEIFDGCGETRRIEFHLEEGEADEIREILKLSKGY